MVQLRCIWNMLMLGLCLITAGVTSAQSLVRGVVTDDTGEPLPFANVYLQANTSNGTTTDFNGEYSLTVPDSNSHVIVFSSIGKQQQNLEVEVGIKDVFVLNVVLKEMSFEIEKAVIEAKANRGGDAYMERMQGNAGTTFDYITTQTLQKTGDSNVPDAVKRVTGVSTVGGYVTVRGLVDRYVKTTVNGSRIPTLDPFTNNIRLDIFPTGLIDNIMIVKTMTPDLPGDWSGAFISIETKDFPDELQLNVSSNFGYNTQSTFKEILTSSRSSTDWLGFDNGFRDIPDIAPTIQSEFPQIINPNLWQQFSYLGLEDELNEYGLTANSPWATGNIYHQIALAELGLLGPAQFNDDFAVQTAIDSYNTHYSRGLFFTAYNQQLEEIGLSFRNTWFTETRMAPMNYSQSVTLGNQILLRERPLGFVFGFRYATNSEFDPDAVLQRTSLSADASEDQELANLRDYKQQISRETSGWSGLANLSYKLNENNNVSVMFMPNFQGRNRARKYEGIREDIFELTLGEDQIYEERQQLLYQIESEHFLPGTKARIDFNGSYTDGKRNILDFKDIRYLWDGNQFLFNSTFNPDRRFRYMLEDLVDSRVKVELPIWEDRIKPTKLSFGGGYQYNTRQNQQIVYTMVGLNEEDLLMGFEEVMSLDRFAIVDSTSFDLSYVNSSSLDDEDIGFLHIASGFAMLDYYFNERLRFVGGLRAEQTNMLVDIRSFYDNDLPKDDPDRYNGNGQLLNPGQINQLNLLPSANVIYKIQDDDVANVNLRLNYSRSLARPSFRELSGLSQFDYELIARVRGNSELEMTDIHNFDIRLESFFQTGTNVSVSGFFKTFENHIELIQTEGGVFTWQNAEQSRIYGLEVEGKKDLTSQLEVRANLTLIRSETTVTVPVQETRAMFGQSPYIFNTILSYSADSIGLNISASYNVQGPKLAVVASTGVAAPDVYELPRHLIDLKASKNIGEHFTFSLRVRNLLNAPTVRSYKFNDGYILDFDRFNFGTIYNLGITYRL